MISEISDTGLSVSQLIALSGDKAIFPFKIRSRTSRFSARIARYIKQRQDASRRRVVAVGNSERRKQKLVWPPSVRVWRGVTARTAAQG